MKAGELTRRVVIEQRSAGKDTSGQALDTPWVPVVSVYAKIQPQAGREIAAGGSVVSNVTALIDIRYRTNVTAAMRARYGTKIYSIEATIDVDLEHKTLRLVCSDGMNRG